MCWNQVHQSHFWWPILDSPMNQEDFYRFHPLCDPIRKSRADLGPDCTEAILSRALRIFLNPIQSNDNQLSFQTTWRLQQLYRDTLHLEWISTSLPYWAGPDQSQSDALATLNTSILWPHRHWIPEHFFAKTIWHTASWSFVDAVERRHWDEYFTYLNDTSFVYSSKDSTENGCQNYARFHVHWQNYFQVPRPCGLLSSPPHSVFPPLVAGIFGSCMASTPLLSWAFAMMFWICLTVETPVEWKWLADLQRMREHVPLCHQ